MTSGLGKRIIQHQTGFFKNAFTSRYNVTELVYFEEFERMEDAIKNREATYLRKNLTELAKFNYLYIYSYSVVYKINDIMLTTTISDFRKDIKQYLDRVTENFETLIINRGKDRGVVIMSLDEYNSLNATYHELSSKTNEKRLDSAIEKLRTGSSFQKDLLEQ